MGTTQKNNLPSNYSLHAIANAFVGLIWTLIVATGDTKTAYYILIPVTFLGAALVFTILELSSRYHPKTRATVSNNRKVNS
ncbi:MAG TPA: hypothetical protein VIK89_00070 [Cytophagaceae bacterium]